MESHCSGKGPLSASDRVSFDFNFILLLDSHVQFDSGSGNNIGNEHDLSVCHGPITVDQSLS